MGGRDDSGRGLVSLITGASSGIGAALARELARRGGDLVLAARRADRLEALAAEIRAMGRRAVAVPCDVTREGDCERAVGRARTELGRLDVAVANAGFGVVGPLARLGLEDYRRQMETNVFGVLRTIYAALPALRETRGRLVLVGSISGYVVTPGGSPYCMSKFAIRALAQALDHELRADGISVTLLSPGFVESEIHEVDNRGVRHPGTRHPAQWLRMPADRAARLMAGAVLARRREAVITGHGKLAVLFQRFLPGLVRSAIALSGRQARPEPTAPP
jgi:short-subunit dehydrogenase